MRRYQVRGTILLRPVGHLQPTETFSVEVEASGIGQAQERAEKLARLAGSEHFFQESVVEIPSCVAA